MAAAEDKIVLISAPFGPFFSPSRALGLLTAELRSLNLSTKVYHCTLRLAELVGAPFYTSKSHWASHSLQMIRRRVALRLSQP